VPTDMTPLWMLDEAGPVFVTSGDDALFIFLVVLRTAWAGVGPAF